MRVSIVGYGWVGKAMQTLFPAAYIYTDKIGKKERVNECEVAFICVPTPLDTNGRLDASIVEETIRWCECRLIVIRSTVNPHDTDRWVETYHKQIVFQPEYLGETPNHPLLNPQNTPFIIIGGKPRWRRHLVDLYTQVYNANIRIRLVTALEAEIIKLSENRAIAFKVMQCQELYDVCEKAGVDYYIIRDAVYGDDPRFNLWWTFIYPQKRGFHSSKCLKKDVAAWCAWAESVGSNNEITKLLVKQSKKLLKYSV